MAYQEDVACNNRQGWPGGEGWSQLLHQGVFAIVALQKPLLRSCRGSHTALIHSAGCLHGAEETRSCLPVVWSMTWLTRNPSHLCRDATVTVNILTSLLC